MNSKLPNSPKFEHRVGSHSDDYGGDADQRCDCQDEPTRSKLHTIIKSCIDDPHDKTIIEAEKAIRQAVGEEVLELITPNQRGQFEADGGHIAWYLDDLQKVIKQWQGGEDG